MALGWESTRDTLDAKSWTCGYCGKAVGGNVGYRRSKSEDKSKRIYICPHCQNPTAFIVEASDEGVVTAHIPGAPYGRDVHDLPDEVEIAYSEARRCVQFRAYTAAALMLRKLLMHVSVDMGAERGEAFSYYVTYLDENHFIPPDGKRWVDELRRYGNEATHKIAVVGEEDAKRLLDFAEMLLLFCYEFPARVHDNV